MVFALATDENTLKVFKDQAEAISYCEGVDVEDGVWLFFDTDGQALEPVITNPTRRGTFTVTSGTYLLRRTEDRPHLSQRLHEITNIEPWGDMKTLADVQRLLTSRRSPTP